VIDESKSPPNLRVDVIFFLSRVVFIIGSLDF